MAGDWIKLEASTLAKPEVMRLARLLGIKRREAVGLLIDFWIWLDKNCVDGHVDGVASQDIDDMMMCTGFSTAMNNVHWLRIDDKAMVMEVPNFDRHNGETAKKRALKNKRQSKWRSKNVDDSVDVQASTTTSTREEKSIKPPIVPRTRSVHKPEQASVQENEHAGFVQFWKTWPSNPRKVNRKGCLEKWRKENLDELVEAIIPHVEVMKRTEQWAQFCPLPMTYLNQRRWEDGTPTGTTPDDERAKKVAWALG